MPRGTCLTRTAAGPWQRELCHSPTTCTTPLLAFSKDRGSYQKTWADREDNEHLVELMAGLDSCSDQFADAVYEALSARYAEVRQGA